MNRNTRKKNMRPHNINVSTLRWIGAGSYGAIYIIPQKNSENLVMKEHSISDITAYEGCETWRHEYDIHTAVYKQCSPLLSNEISIVRPISFGYAKRTSEKFLTTTIKNASSCYIVMERIHGRHPFNPYVEKKLTNILAEPHKISLAPTTPF